MPDKNIIKNRIRNDKPIILQKEGITLIFWQDKRLVSVISNDGRPEMITQSRFQKNGKRKRFEIPAGILDYRKNMSGVDLFDLFDQRYSYYLYPHTFKKWWKITLFSSLN